MMDNRRLLYFLEGSLRKNRSIYYTHGTCTPEDFKILFEFIVSVNPDFVEESQSIAQMQN